MPKKVRVYELRKELDLTIEQVLTLCESLGVDASSHSSSMDEAQADRVRRKVEREGLAGTPADEIEDEDEILAKIERAKRRAVVKPRAKKADPKKAASEKAASEKAASEKAGTAKAGTAKTSSATGKAASGKAATGKAATSASAQTAAGATAAGKAAGKATGKTASKATGKATASDSASLEESGTAAGTAATGAAADGSAAGTAAADGSAAGTAAADGSAAGTATGTAKAKGKASTAKAGTAKEGTAKTAGKAATGKGGKGAAAPAGSAAADTSTATGATAGITSDGAASTGIRSDGAATAGTTSGAAAGTASAGTAADAAAAVGADAAGTAVSSDGAIAASSGASTAAGAAATATGTTSAGTGAGTAAGTSTGTASTGTAADAPEQAPPASSAGPLVVSTGTESARPGTSQSSSSQSSSSQAAGSAAGRTSSAATSKSAAGTGTGTSAGTGAGTTGKAAAGTGTGGTATAKSAGTGTAAGTAPAPPRVPPPAGVPPVPPPPRPAARNTPLLSPGGKPIPPPPPPTRVRSGAPRRGGPGGVDTGARPSTERPFRRPSPGAGRPGGARPGGGPGGPGSGPGGPRSDNTRPDGGRPGGPRPMPNRRGRRPRRRRRQREELLPQEMPTYTPADAPVPQGVVTIERGTTAKEIAAKLNRSAADVVRFLLQQGEMVTANQSLSDDMIELFAAEIAAEVQLVEPGEEQEQELLKDLDIELDITTGDLTARPPVVTVMGHVDHGKTLLLDRIREANVAEAEAGGITQHIGAYQVDRNGRLITFIDTPGHEAFTAMRARGAQATDIVILVVAADDGVMPQTAEAIAHARSADVPIVVAVNKMDREQADLNRVLAQLSDHNLVPESYGGDVITIPVSALNAEGIDELLDQVLLLAELEELTAAEGGRARGVVLEAHLDKGRGPVATTLVQHGILKVGDAVVAGASWGRIRAMADDHGKPLTEAGPSTPVEVLGFGEVPRSGDMVIVAQDEKRASKAAETREHWQRQASLAGTAGGSVQSGARLEDIFTQVQAGETAMLNVVLKADVHGSLEAVTDSLKKLERPDVKLTFVSRGVGGVNENDIQLALASNASVIGFNVRPDRKARQMAEDEGIEVRLYEIIYRLIEDVQHAMLGMLAPEFEEIVTGEAQVREVFRISRVGPVAGCVVEHGNVKAGAKVRFLREGTIIWKGAVKSLRHFRDDVQEVTAGMECGIGLSDFSDLKEGDVIETYEEREIARV